MNIFLTSLMHPNTASDYSKVLEHFEMSLNSILNQDNQHLKIIVVCNEIPRIRINSDKMEFILVDFHAADTSKDPESKRLDKACKLVHGLRNSLKLDPETVYFFDADDWLNSKVNSYIESNSRYVGFKAVTGFVVDYSTKKYSIKYGISRYCGSTFAVNYKVIMKLIPSLSKLHDKMSKDDTIELIGRDLLINLFDAHRFDEYFLANGIDGKFRNFPFPTVCWIRNTGDNILNSEKGHNGLYLTEEIVKNFGLDLYLKELTPQSNANSILSFIGFHYEQFKSFCGYKLKGRPRYF